MTNIPSLGFPDPSTMPAEMPVPLGGEGEGQPFCELLESLSAEVETPLAAEVEILPVDTVAILPMEDGGEDDLEGGGVAEAEPDADVMVLSSCLAMWQILPPVTPALTASAGKDVDCEDISLAGRDSDGDATISAHPATPDAARSGPVREAKAQATLCGLAGMPFQESTAQPQGGTSRDPVVGKGTTVPSLKSAERQPIAGRVATAHAMEVAAGDPAVAARSSVIPPEPLRAGSTERSERAAISSDSKTPLEVAAVAEVPRAASDGIPDAKEQRAMTEIVFHRSEKSAPAPFAASETESNLEPVSRESTDGGAIALTEPMGQEESGGRAMDGREQRDARDRFPAVAGIEAPNEFEVSKSDRKPALENAAQAIEHIERAIERMRSHGNQRLEMRLPLRDGEEVVVKLRIEHGEVKATFQSASEGLRQALETGWSQAGQTLPERAARALPGVFESPSMQSGMGSFQQSPKQRERENHEPNGEPAFRPLPSPVERPRASEPRRPSPPAGPSVTLKLYA